SISILLGGRGEDSRDKCRDILEAAKENITALGDYGTKDGDPAKLQRLIEDFEILMPQPRMAQTTGKSHSQAVDNAFDRADGILNNQLDKLTLQFEDTSPAFFLDY